MLKIGSKVINSQFGGEVNGKLSTILSYWVNKMGIKEEDIQIDLLGEQDVKKFTEDLLDLEEITGMEDSFVARNITKRLLTLPIYKYYLEIYAGEKNEQHELNGIDSLSVLSRNQLGLVYSPGVGYVSNHMFKTEKNEFNDFCRTNRYCYTYSPETKELTRPEFMYSEMREENVNMFTITDGSATLGIGNVGESSLPVMFGKTVLLEAFGGQTVRSDICYVDTQNIWEEVWKHPRGSDEIKKEWNRIVDACIDAVVLIKEKHPDAMIMLEDIAAPVCFDIEEKLNEKGIFTIHDDQWGTAIIFAAGVYNAIKLTDRKPEDIKKVVFSGAGASAVAVSKTMQTLGVENIIAFDSRGAIHHGRDDLTPTKERLAEMNIEGFTGSIEEALEGADGFVGLSQPALFKGREVEMLSKMKNGAFVFAGANPDPEFDMFTLDKEKQEGGKLTNISYIACGAFGKPGSTLNNSSAFPGLYRALTDAYIEKKLLDTKNVSNAEIAVESAKGLASVVEERDIIKGSIVPRTFTQDGYNFKVTQAVATNVWQLVTGESEELAIKKYENLSSELIELQSKNMEKYQNISKESKIFVNGMIDLMGESEYPVMKELKKNIVV